MANTTNLYTKIYSVVQKIPSGRVATYGQVARLIGSPRSAQVVGWALRALPIDRTDVPWQRVINKAGMISIENMDAPKEEQAALLRAEGIEITEKEGNLWVDMEKYGWKTDNAIS